MHLKLYSQFSTSVFILDINRWFYLSYPQSLQSEKMHLSAQSAAQYVQVPLIRQLLASTTRQQMFVNSLALRVFLLLEAGYHMSGSGPNIARGAVWTLTFKF